MIYNLNVKPFILAGSLLSNITYALPAVNDSNQEGVIVETSVLWKTPISSVPLYSDNQYSPLWHYNNATYFVWADATHRPWITKVREGNVQTVPLDNNVDYKAMADSHNRFSIGIDKKGFIHVAGDMHNYTSGTTSPYPPRYQKQSMMYWKSTQPENIVNGFEFVGGKDAPTTMPGSGYSYGKFFTDNNNELFYSARVKAIAQSHTSGEMGLGLYRYNTDTQTWIALGGKAEDTRPGTYYDVLVWENAGMAPEKWYQGFMTNLKFDSHNRLHMAASLNSNNTLAGNNRLIYAYSNDGGITWNKQSAQKISPLPIRAQDGLTNQGDLVNEQNTAPFFDSKVKVIADKNGTPGILNGPLYVWSGADGWKNQGDKFLLANTVSVDPKGNLILTASGSAKMFRANSFNSNVYGYDFTGYKQYEALDDYSLKRTGVLYGIGINAVDKTQSILKTSIIPAPLPAEWHGQDIAAKQVTYSGTSGYKDGKFIVNDYGIQIDNPTDSFYYVYKTMYGDGVITARVTPQAASGNARAGVMMRESLAFNSRDVFSLLVPGKNSAIFGFRANTGGQTGNLWVGGTEKSAWLRLVREGDVFTGFMSKDGKNWVQTGQTTMKLPVRLFVGLASASYNHYNMQKTVFDLVNAPVNGMTTKDHLASIQ